MDLLETYHAQRSGEQLSAWLLIDQGMIDRFAAATFDHQFIHTDPARAATSPFGGTIAHGFLIVSLLVHLRDETPGLAFPGSRMSVNVGFDKLRFISPVPSGSRIRARWTLAGLEEKAPGTFQCIDEVTIEIEGGAKPAMAASWLTRFIV